MDDGVVAEALELVAVAEVAPLLDAAAAGAASAPFSPAELAYARSKRDPERRLAARLAAKRAALALLGAGFELGDAEIRRSPGGPPELRLSERAHLRVRGLGAERVLVSLSHG